MPSFIEQLKERAIARQFRRDLIEALDRPMPRRKAPPPRALVKLRELANQANLTAEQLARIWKVAKGFSADQRDEILSILAKNPNISDEVFKDLMQQYPSSAAHNPMIPLRSLEDPTWAKRTVGMSSAHGLIQYGHPDAMIFVGPPTYSWRFTHLHGRGGVLTGLDTRFDPPIDQIDIWTWPRGDFFVGEQNHVVRFTKKDGSRLVTRGLLEPEAKELLGVAEWATFLRNNYIKNPVAFLQGQAD